MVTNGGKCVSAALREDGTAFRYSEKHCCISLESPFRAVVYKPFKMAVYPKWGPGAAPRTKAQSIRLAEASYGVMVLDGRW
jgi:hypothetical protein